MIEMCLAGEAACGGDDSLLFGYQMSVTRFNPHASEHTCAVAGPRQEVLRKGPQAQPVEIPDRIQLKR